MLSVAQPVQIKSARKKETIAGGKEVRKVDSKEGRKEGQEGWKEGRVVSSHSLKCKSQFTPGPGLRSWRKVVRTRR